MHILMVHNRYLIRGGEDESTDMETELLRTHGHQVDLVELDNQSISRRNLLKTSIETVWSSRSYNSIRKKIQANSCDVVHVQNFFPQFSPSVHYAAKALHMPVVQSLRNYRLLCLNGLFYRDGHTCEDCVGRPLTWPGVLHKCYRHSLSGSLVLTSMLSTHRLLRTWHTKVDIFFTLSEFARAKLISGGLPADKILVKPNFVYPDPGVDERERKHVLLVSRLVEEKGIPVVLEAWEKLGTHIPLKIVGDGPLAAHVQSVVRGMPWIEYFGKKSLSEVYDLMGQAWFVLFPTGLYETFGRVVIEAYAKGTPVIASDIGSGARLVEDGRTGLLFRAQDAEDLAQKVRWLWERPDDARKFGHQARATFEAHYTAERNYEILMDIYQKAVAVNRAKFG